VLISSTNVTQKTSIRLSIEKKPHHVLMLRLFPFICSMWNANQLIDDREIHQQMKPLTYLRKLRELWVGLSTIESKWIPYRNQIQTDTYILGSALPSTSLVEQINNLPLETALYWDKQWIAYRSAKPTTQHNQITYLSERPDFIQYPEDLLDLNRHALKKEIKPNTINLTALRADGNTIIHPENCHIDPSAEIKGTILDASQGPIYIGANVKLQIGTCIQGPVAFLEDSSTNVGAKIRPDTIIGSGCKVGGEVSASLFFPNSNKAHEGYLGNSIIGSFCNLGALTSTSNVRNDLKTVQLYDYASNTQRDTQRKSFGVLMGDFVCTGIQTKFNTGTVIGNHCNVSGSQFLPKFIPSLTWGEFPNFSGYKVEKAAINALAWAEAKNQKIPENLSDIIQQIWKEEANARN
jgi:UDP-N-acetylglucosamine diphosphorylase/glucosamine-1-phosphate N-acetyltransferase